MSLLSELAKKTKLPVWGLIAAAVAAGVLIVKFLFS